MDTQNNLGIWISQTEDLSLIPQVLSKLQKDNDVFIITELDILDDKYMIVSPYYIMFHDFTAVFLSAESLIENRDHLKTQNIVLCHKSDDSSELLNPKTLSNVRLIEL